MAALVGLGYRRLWLEELLALEDGQIDLLEVVVDQVRGPRWLDLNRLAERFRIIPHGLGLSLGTAFRPPADYVSHIERIVALTNPPYFSEHVAVTKVPGIDIESLTPVLRTAGQLNLVVQNIDYWQDRLNVQLVVENSADMFTLLPHEMSSAEFMNGLCSRTGCGLLLDLANVAVSRWNLGEGGGDTAYLNDLDPSNVRHVHLAGQTYRGRFAIDSHATNVPDDTFALLEKMVVIAEGKVDFNVTVERDARLPGLSEMLAELTRVRNTLACGEQGFMSHA